MIKLVLPVNIGRDFFLQCSTAKLTGKPKNERIELAITEIAA
jgi:hypothetical protein